MNLEHEFYDSKLIQLSLLGTQHEEL